MSSPGSISSVNIVDLSNDLIQAGDSIRIDIKITRPYEVTLLNDFELRWVENGNVIMTQPVSVPAGETVTISLSGSMPSHDIIAKFELWFHNIWFVPFPVPTLEKQDTVDFTIRLGQPGTSPVDITHTNNISSTLMNIALILGIGAGLGYVLSNKASDARRTVRRRRIYE